MPLELSNSFEHGFALDEKEIRRIIDLIGERISDDTGTKSTLTIKYRLKNGAVIESPTSEQFFQEENYGSKMITRLELSWTGSHEDNNAEIVITDIDSDPEEKKSIRYKLTGENRDTLFSLASELDERIAKKQKVRILFQI